MLESFSGVLLSTPALVRYFCDKGLHSMLHLYPPVARDADGIPRPEARENGPLCVGYFGGPHRNEPFRRLVLPALRELSSRVPVELVVTGLDPSSLEGAGLAVTAFPSERSYDVALRRMASRGIDVLVHPNSDTRNNPYKTQHVLLNAAAMGAAPVLSDAPPYDSLGAVGAALLCGSDPGEWARRSPVSRSRRTCVARSSRALAALPDTLLGPGKRGGADGSPGDPSVAGPRTARSALPAGPALRARGSNRPGPRSHPGAGPGLDVRGDRIPGRRPAAGDHDGRQLRPPRERPCPARRGGSRLRRTLREAVGQLDDVWDWVVVPFEFEAIPEAMARRFELRFIPETDHPVALFETTSRCRGIRRRVLRRLRRDRHADDLQVELG